MKLQVQCDECGVIGTGDAISFYKEYEKDLCEGCYAKLEVDYLKQKRREKMHWLENTHLQEIRDLDEKIAALELKVTP